MVWQLVKRMVGKWVSDVKDVAIYALGRGCLPGGKMACQIMNRGYGTLDIVKKISIVEYVSPSNTTSPIHLIADVRKRF